MASFGLFKTTTANLHQTPPMKASSSTTTTTMSTNLTTSLEVKTSHEKQSLASKHSHTIHHIDKYMKMEPSSSTSTQKSPLDIGIIGLGDFGQFLSKAFKKQGHNVLGTSRSDYSEYCKEHGVEFFGNINGLCEAQPDILIVCSSILSTETVVHKIPFQKLKPNTILADVLSVKQFPKKLFLDVVPKEFGILCTHPMFGKFSGNNSWEGLRFVYEKVRIAENSIQKQICEEFLSIFRDQGCRMVEMSCEEHDRFAAETQFITHTIARILSEMNLESTPIDTKGYETLVQLTQNATSHSADLYDGLYLYNANAVKQIEKLDRAFETVKQHLFGKLRYKFRKQLEESVATEKTTDQSSSSYFLPMSDDVKDLSSFSMVSEQETKMHQMNSDMKITVPRYRET